MLRRFRPGTGDKSPLTISGDRRGVLCLHGFTGTPFEIRPLAEALGRAGCTVEAPFQLLSFLALSVIPSLKITDRGLVDVDRFQIVPLKI